jgi:hypothetical protein
MKRFSYAGIISALIAVLCIGLHSCKNAGNRKRLANFRYEAFKDSIRSVHGNTVIDTSNIFDAGVFTPGQDSLNALLITMDTFLHRDAYMMTLTDTSKLKTGLKFTDKEKETVSANVKTLDSFLNHLDTTVISPCREKECTLYAEINKFSQKLYLYIEGELKDSFNVSTGIRKYETPNLNLQPRGPMLIKYMSKKFPGGNYKGLGNMPYAVFLRGGYAIHGTTPGNFVKLGTRASHGCIRLHPDDAILFFELVKRVGLDQTWIKIRDSVPN